MILIKPDNTRRIDITGVPAPVKRPVDIDQARTGFTTLRTLRIYRFEAGSVIEGHAEEDEVFIVLLSGSAELTMIENLDTPADPGHPVTLSAPEDEDGAACAAYLPSGAAYKLIAKTDADVAYARATSTGTRRAKVFSSSVRAGIHDVRFLLEETDYAERLHLRLVQIDARQKDTAIMPINESEATCEALVHVRTMPAAGVATISKSGAEPIVLDSWDTVSLAPGERPVLGIAMGCSALALIVCTSD